MENNNEKSLNRDQVRSMLLDQIDTSNEVHVADKICAKLTGYILGLDKNPPAEILECINMIPELLIEAIENERKKT